MEILPQKDNKKINISMESIMNLATVDMPRINETESFTDWIKWDTNNLFPEKLIDGLNSSPTHNSIILTKSQMTSGKRILITPENKGLLGRFFKKGENKKTQDFIDKANDNGESLKDIINKLGKDYWTFGMCYFQPVYKGDGRLQIYHIPADYIRSGKINDKTGMVQDYYYSRSWKDYRKTEYKPVQLTRFDYMNKRKQSIVPIINYRPGSKYYPVPEYYPAFNYIELDGEISKFHLSNMKNGLVPSMMIQFNQGVPTTEQMDQIKRKIEDTFTGSENAGRFLLFFNDSKETAATIETLQVNEIDKLYVLLNEMVVQNILTASRLTSPLLIGVKTEGQLGIVDEMKSAYELFLNQVILPVQTKIMDEINKVGLFSGLQNMVIETPSPLDFVFSESILGKILTVNELRREIGYEDHEDGDTLIEYKKETDIVENPNQKTKTNDNE